MPVVFTKDKQIDGYGKTGFFLLRSYNKYTLELLK